MLLLPSGRRKLKAEEAERQAFIDAWDAKRKPIFEKYNALTQAEQLRYEAEIDPLYKNHQRIVNELFTKVMDELKALDTEVLAAEAQKLQAEQHSDNCEGCHGVGN